MEAVRQPLFHFSHDASGAHEAGSRKNVVVIVDLIDMSTTLEAALEAGALNVYGACPEASNVPVPVDAYQIGLAAGSQALALGVPVVVAAEPRWGSSRERADSCRSLDRGLRKAGLKEYTIVPNLGIGTNKLIDFKDKIAIAVTNSGGAAFDAAFQAGGTVLTATVVRTWQKKGLEPARVGVHRALNKAYELGKDITFVAASSNSWEDMLAAQFLVQLAVTESKTMFNRKKTV